MYRPFRHRPRSPSPGLPTHRHRHIARLRIPYLRSPLALLVGVGVLLLVFLYYRTGSLLHGISPFHKAIAQDPHLTKALGDTYQSFLSSCPSHPVLPVHSSHFLTSSQRQRYAHLSSSTKGKCMLVTTTRQIADQLPDLLSTLIVLTHFLSPENIRLSILEGPSDDCTPEVLQHVLLPTLLQLGVPSTSISIITDEPKIDWSQHNRIEVIAELRNKALAPLWDRSWGQDTAAVIFFNDVYLHAVDVLEVLHQHVKSGAGISTAMDWWKKRPEYYYDVWVGRTLDGDLFYPIDQPSWSPSSDLFPQSPSTRSAYAKLQPFQVYSSWNALAVLDPTPFITHQTRFRRGDRAKGECAASECTLIAADFWKVGFGKVQVVPSVQLAYERDVAEEIIEDTGRQKKSLGWVGGVPPKSLNRPLEWIDKPPEKVRCHPWPEVNGLSANVWEKTVWVDPWLD